MKNKTMTAYVVPRKGVYSYWVWNLSGDSQKEETTVDVIGESARCFYIKLKTFLNGHRPGDVMRVGRKAVKMERTMPDYTNAWWNR
ncbi:MAG: hypothetical protein K5867_04085 [Bacteroidales bacterium]|nr:hypothetical protein [Bacteroidales bacterium]